jgi:hypothetical protein
MNLLIVLIQFMRNDIILCTYKTYVLLLFHILLISLIPLTIAYQVLIDVVEAH